MPAFQIIALDTATPQLRAPGTGDTYVAPRAVDITPETLTGTSATSSLSIAQTWNTTGTPTAFDLNVTDTASNVSSLLMNLRVGGANRISVSKTGAVIAVAGANTTSGFYVGGSTANGIYSPSTAQLFLSGGGSVVEVRTSGLGLGSSSLSWGTLGATQNLILTRDAADTLAQRNGVNAQAFRVYGTFTDASNYQRLRLSTDSIFTENAGTGAAQSLALGGTSTGARMVLNPSGVIQIYGPSVANIWNFNASGHFVAGADNTYDIGASGASRPRYLYLGGGSLTGTQADSSLSIAPTWNTTGTPTAIDLNVTDTASNAASLLMNLRVGGTNRLSVDKTGAVVISDGTSALTIDSTNGAATLLQTAAMLFQTSNSLIMRHGNSDAFGIRSVSSGDARLDFLSTANAVQVRLTTDAANTLAQRNGTAAQAFNIYNTFTDASNYERGYRRWVGNVMQIGTEKLGTGTARALELQTDGVTRLTIATTGAATFSSNALFANGNGVGRSSADIQFYDAAINVVKDFQLIGKFLSLSEQTAPAAPAANGVRIYAQDNGAGKTQLMALFATGAAQQIAIEP